VTNIPILYSFRRCPYAIRARLAIRYAQIQVEIREVLLSDKPESMLAVSPKGTVPVLVLEDGTVLDESMDIISWALNINDPDKWQVTHDDSLVKKLLEQNDGPFKQQLDHYKYAERFPAKSRQAYREQGEVFLSQLENKLSLHSYLSGEHLGQVDIAIFPFIRQFAYVDKDWFDQLPYLNLQAWLTEIINSELFAYVMQKYDRWLKNSETQKF